MMKCCGQNGHASQAACVACEFVGPTNTSAATAVTPDCHCGSSKTHSGEDRRAPATAHRPAAAYSSASAINSVIVMSIACAIRMTDITPGFCPPRPILLMYERSTALRCASSSCDTPCARRQRRMAAPSATSAGSFACRGDVTGMPSWSTYDADHTTDDLPQCHAQWPLSSIPRAPPRPARSREYAAANKETVSHRHPQGAVFAPCPAGLGGFRLAPRRTLNQT
jgi:hypothetical protein